MKKLLTLGAALGILAGLATLSTAPVRADSVGIGVGGGIGISYSTGGYCDRWGCPDDFWDYPIFYCPVFYEDEWYSGPLYYRVWGDEPYFWVHGGWHEDEWDADERPAWACTDRFGPPRDYDWYVDNGFYWPEALIYDYYVEYAAFYPGYDFAWWREHHRGWDRDHHFDRWRDEHHRSWWGHHGFDRDWQHERGGQFWIGGHGWTAAVDRHDRSSWWTGGNRAQHELKRGQPSIEHASLGGHSHSFDQHKASAGGWVTGDRHVRSGDWFAHSNQSLTEHHSTSSGHDWFGQAAGGQEHRFSHYEQPRGNLAPVRPTEPHMNNFTPHFSSGGRGSGHPQEGNSGRKPH